MVSFPALWPLAFDMQEFVAPYTDRGAMVQPSAPPYSQQVYQNQVRQQPRQLEALDCNFGLSMYGGSPQYNVGGSPNGRDTRSLSSSPMPATPQEIKPLPAYFVEPPKVNSYDFSMFGAGEQQYIAPPLYSYIPEGQQGLLYLGF